MRPVKTSNAGCSRGSYGTIALIPRSCSVSWGTWYEHVSFQTKRLGIKRTTVVYFWVSVGALTAMARHAFRRFSHVPEWILSLAVVFASRDFSRASSLNLINAVALSENTELKHLSIRSASVPLILLRVTTELIELHLYNLLPRRYGVGRYVARYPE